MHKFWQINLEDHASAIKVLAHRNPERLELRKNWGVPAIVFVSDYRLRDALSEIGEWCEETGITYWIERVGSFTFIEFKTDLDAVAFKLRWF